MRRSGQQGKVVVIIIVLVVIVLGVVFVPRLSVSTKECDSLQNNDRDICLFKLAAKRDNTKICEKISDANGNALQSFCLTKAWKGSDCTYASLINDYSCYTSLATSRKNIDYCLQINSPHDLEICTNQTVNLAIKERDPTICERGIAFSCTTQIAVALKDSSFCSSLQDPTLRQDCVSLVKSPNATGVTHA